MIFNQKFSWLEHSTSVQQLCTYIAMYIYSYVCTYIATYIYSYIHIQLCTYIATYIYYSTFALLFVPWCTEKLILVFASHNSFVQCILFFRKHTLYNILLHENKGGQPNYMIPGSHQSSTFSMCLKLSVKLTIKVSMQFTNKYKFYPIKIFLLHIVGLLYKKNHLQQLLLMYQYQCCYQCYF